MESTLSFKGASWATPAELLRPTFRNWYQGHYPYVFAKFRCVSSLKLIIYQEPFLESGIGEPRDVLSESRHLYGGK